MKKKILDIDIAKNARQYIADFRIEGKKPLWAQLGNGTTVHFLDMTDDEAIHIAHLMAHMEISSADSKNKH